MTRNSSLRPDRSARRALEPSVADIRNSSCADPTVTKPALSDLQGARLDSVRDAMLAYPFVSDSEMLGRTVTRVSEPSPPTICTVKGNIGGLESVRIEVGCSIECRSTTG